ncbi:MAG: CDP-glucose 4,6-dehydratase, partial [Methylotenera sp.]
EGAHTVAWIVDKLIATVPNSKWQIDQKPQLHEANYLKLDSSKARIQLGWHPRWSLDVALEKIMNWHQYWRNDGDMHQFSLMQIAEYQNAMKA